METSRIICLERDGVNATAIGDTIIQRTRDSSPALYLYPMFISISVVLVTALVTPATVSIGTNSPNYDNILGATALTSLGAVNQQQRYTPTAVLTGVSPNIDVYTRVSIAAVASAFTYAPRVWGYYAP